MRTGQIIFLASLLAAVPLTAQDKEQGNFPFNNTTAVGAEAFLKAHPTYDGRGTVVAVLDCGVHLGIPGLVTTSDGKPKIIDARDFTGEGDIKLVQAKVVKEAGKAKLALGRDRWTGFGALPHKAKGPYYLAIFDEARLINNPELKDLNQNGTSLRDKWAFLVFQTVDGFWVAYPDTDMDHDFADEKGLRDYIVNRDTFQFGPRSPKKQRTVMLCSITVRPGEKILEVYYPTGSHGTHVSGMATGYHMNGNPHHNGIAPGAQVLALKLGHCGAAGGASTTGAMIKCYEYAAKWAKAHPKTPVIVNMSYGVGCEIEGKSKITLLLDNLFKANPGILCTISNGNEGPGLSNTGLPADSKYVWSAGAMMAVDTLASVWGADIKTHKPFIFTSRGGELPKPDGIAPGGAAATVPRYLTRDAMWGTSMASPQTAGFMACVASACKAEKIPYTNMLFYRAMRNAAKPLAGWNELDQGAGLIQMGKTYEYLKTYASRKEHEQLFAYDIGAQAPNQPRGICRAAYYRNCDWFPAYPSQTAFRIRPVFNKGMTPDQKNQFYRAFDFVPTQSWIRIDKPSCYMRGPGGMTLNAWYDADALAKPGLYVGMILAYRKGLPHTPENIDFRLWNTIVVPHRLTAENRYTVNFKKQQVAPGDIERFFVTVPAGMQSLTCRLTSPEGEFCRALVSIFAPDGEEIAGWDIKNDAKPGPSYNSVVGRKLYPGVWEVVIWGYYKNRKVSTYNLNIQTSGFKSTPRQVESFTFRHPRPPMGAVTVTNLVNRTFNGEISGEILGYTRSFKKEICASKWAYPFTMPTGVTRVQFELKLSRADYGLFTDFGVEVQDSKGKALTQAGFGYDSLNVTLPNRKPGTTYYLTLIPGYATKRPSPFTLKVREDYLTAKKIDIRVNGGTLYPFVAQKLPFILSEAPAPVPQGFESLGQIIFKDAAEEQIRGFVPVRFKVGLPK